MLTGMEKPRSHASLSLLFKRSRSVFPAIQTALSRNEFSNMRETQKLVQTQKRYDVDLVPLWTQWFVGRWRNSHETVEIIDYPHFQAK